MTSGLVGASMSLVASIFIGSSGTAGMTLCLTSGHLMKLNRGLLPPQYVKVPSVHLDTCHTSRISILLLGLSLEKITEWKRSTTVHMCQSRSKLIDLLSGLCGRGGRVKTCSEAPLEVEAAGE